MEITKRDTSIIKGFAICCMLWHHLFYKTQDYGVFVQQLGVLGKCCVFLFLFVSGYGLTKQFERLPKFNVVSSLRFVFLRLTKFYMQYWFYFVIVIGVGLIFWRSLGEAYPNRNPIKCLILDGLGMMGYSSYNPTWWFNKMIIQLYILYPLLFLLLYNRIIAAVSLLVVIVLQQFVPVNLFCLVEGGLLAFFLGMLMAKYSLKNLSTTFLLLVSIALLGVFIYGFFNVHIISVNIMFSGIAFFISSLLVIIGRRYQFPILGYLGGYATAMYFVHTLIQSLVSDYIYSIAYSVLVFIVLVALSLISSILLKKLEEFVGYKKLKNNVIHFISSFQPLRSNG